MEYVCPRCGTPARGASICTSCGLDLDAQPELPTGEEYAAGGIEAVREQHRASVPTGPGRPGTLGKRWVAALVDSLVAVVAGVAVFGLVSVLADGDAAFAAGYVAFLLVTLLYPPGMLALNGGMTLGKQVMGIRVRNHGGAPIGFGRALVRESVVKLAFGIVGFIYIVDGIVALANDQRRSLHDMMCSTEVVTTS